MSVPFSMMPGALLLDPDMTVSAVKAWHVIYTETLGRPGWDLSYGQIAEKIGADKRTAMRAVALLVEKGWLMKTAQQSSSGDDGPNLYAVCREPFVLWNATTEDAVVTRATGGSDSDVTGVVTQGALGGSDTPVTHQKNHLPEERFAASPRDDEPPASPIHQFALIAAPEQPKKRVAPTTNTGKIVGEYVTWRTSSGSSPPSASVKRRIGAAIKEAVEAGTSEQDIKRGLHAWHKSGNSPASLATFIDGEARGRRAGTPPQRTEKYQLDPKTGLPW